MPDFELVVLGVGDTFTERHHTSALLLSCDGFQLGIDCPDTYRAALRSASETSGRKLALADVDHFAVTHLHGDHVNGLEGIAFYKRFAEEKRATLITSPEIGAEIWERRLEASMGLLWDGAAHRRMTFGDYFELVALRGREAVDVGPFRIRSHPTRHHIPCNALLIEAAGRRLGYSADTAFDPELLAFLGEADLIIHETNLGPAHTPWLELAALPADLRARMRLIHYPDGFAPPGGELALLHEGEVLRP